jgi:hypothetical protein
MQHMKKLVIFLIIVLLTTGFANTLSAQCSICTKTASQLGEKQGRGLNGGIIYLMLTPLAIGSFIGYRWWKTEKNLKAGDTTDN